MLPDRVSNPGPLTYESGALPIPDTCLTEILLSIHPSKIYLKKLDRYMQKDAYRLSQQICAVWSEGLLLAQTTNIVRSIRLGRWESLSLLTL